MKPPLIGITAGSDPERPGYYLLRQDYLRSVEMAGGIPVVLAPSGPALHPALVDRLDGLVFTGGIDVSPEAYGEKRHPSVVDVSEERDEFEVILLAEALERDIPVLGVCRGMQLLNVELGGSLVQDIPTETGSPLRHLVVDRPRHETVHEVEIVPGCQLHRLLGRVRVPVNSLHHQAVRRLGRGLVATAHAPDGTVEALELEGSSRFILGVQWHPESFWDHGAPFAPLFEGFVAAASAHRTPPSAFVPTAV